MTLMGYISAFAKWHQVPVEEVKALVSEYAQQQHTSPDGLGHNRVRNLTLRPFDDTNPAWISTLAQCVPQAVPKTKVKRDQREVRRLSQRLILHCLACCAGHPVAQ